MWINILGVKVRTDIFVRMSILELDIRINSFVAVLRKESFMIRKKLAL